MSAKAEVCSQKTKGISAGANAFRASRLSLKMLSNQYLSHTVTSIPTFPGLSGSGSTTFWAPTYFLNNLWQTDQANKFAFILEKLTKLSEIKILSLLNWG